VGALDAVGRHRARAPRTQAWRLTRGSGYCRRRHMKCLYSIPFRPIMALAQLASVALVAGGFSGEPLPAPALPRANLQFVE
jgi:hypothetical protein